MDNPALRLKGLTKQYQDVLAVDSLDLTVNRGEIYGFLGRNGAGKTTTIRMILGLIKPTGGSAEIFGIPIQSDRASAVSRTGSLVETATSYPTLTTKENLELQRKLVGAPAGETDRVIELLGLSDFAGRRAGRLSLGNRQRLALARTLIGSPKLLVLDEPANALDPAGIVEVRKLLRKLSDEEGTTVFVSSHILGEISQLADRIGIIHRGMLIEEFTLSEWSGKALPEGYRMATDDNGRAVKIIGDLYPEIRLDWREDGEFIQIQGSAIDPAVLARIIVRKNIGLKALIPEREDLEERFLKLTGGQS